MQSLDENLSIDFRNHVKQYDYKISHLTLYLTCNNRCHQKTVERY